MPRSPRRPASPLDTPDPRFEGSAYSNQECAFLLEHLGEPALVAMPPDEDLPEGVNEAMMERTLDRTHALALYEQTLQERAKDDTIRIWCGFEALRDVLRKTVEWRATRDELVRRTRGQRGELRRAAGAPSLHMWDPSTGMPTLGASGADADRVLTRITTTGQREELHVEMRETGGGSIKTLSGALGFITKQEAIHTSDALLAQTPDDLQYDNSGDRFGIVTCPLCGKSETFEQAKTTAKRNAVNRITKHLLEEKHIKVDAHRLLHARLKSGRAGASTNRIPVSTAGAAAEA